MDVTPEMIEAVRAHEKSQAAREAEEYRLEYERRVEEKYKRLRVGALAQARSIIGGLTEESFGILTDIFSEYLHELEGW